MNFQLIRFEGCSSSRKQADVLFIFNAIFSSLFKEFERVLDENHGFRLSSTVTPLQIGPLPFGLVC